MNATLSSKTCEARGCYGLSAVVVLAAFGWLCGGSNLHAVLPFGLSTDGDGEFVNGSWSGDGTVVANQTPGNFNVDGVTVDTVVQDFTSGSLQIDAGSLYPQPRITSGQGVTVSVSFTGGTGDFLLANSNSFDGGNLMYNSFGLTDLDGVTAITLTLSYLQPIAARDDVTTGL